MKIRVGILGCANIAKRSLAPAFIDHPAFELVAVASRSLDKAREFICGLQPQPLNIRPMPYDELVLSPEIDLVYCPLPTGLHYEWVKKCLLTGKHVLCEKSLACNFSEVEDLVSTAKANNCFLMESFQFRFHPQNLYVKKLLADNAIGELRNIIVHFGIPPFSEGMKNIRYSKHLGGGALLDNGAYTIKAATYLLGLDSNVRVLAAMSGGNTPELGDVDLTGSLMLSATYHTSDLKNKTVSIQTSYGFDHFYQNCYEIWGTEGKISTVRAFTAREDFAAPVTVETKSGKDVKTFSANHFSALLDYVSCAVASGDFETEYHECLKQSRILTEARRMMNL